MVKWRRKASSSLSNSKTIGFKGRRCNHAYRHSAAKNTEACTLDGHLQQDRLQSLVPATDVSCSSFTSFYEVILPYQIVQPHSRRRPAHSLVTGCCGPLQICCGLSVAEASCTYVIALSAHSAATRPWHLHLLLHGAENACRACIGRRLDELMLTCHGQRNALIRDSHLSEHKEAFSLISFANISAQLVSTTIIVQHPCPTEAQPVSICSCGISALQT